MRSVCFSLVKSYLSYLTISISGGKLYRDISASVNPVDLKDWLSPNGSFIVNSNADILSFLDGFTEEQIARSARWSCLYASAHGKRFEAGEPAMKNCVSNHWWVVYKGRMLTRGIRIPK